MARHDREDVTAQREAVTTARATFAELLLDLAFLAAKEGAGDVDAESRALAKTLTSKAKRPPAVDSAAWLGALSAARRHHDAYSTEYDVAEQRARDAERALDTALIDLHTASGGGGFG